MYFAIIGIISLFVFLEMFNKDIIEKYKYVFAFTCFALLVFQDGFRWETGTDWDPYHNFFEDLTISIQPEDSDFDIGYVIFTYIIRSISDNPNGKNNITFEKFLETASKRCAQIIEEFFVTS